MIWELLGREPRTARELAEVLACDVRDIRRMIHEERQSGVLICASNDSRFPGYYLADGEEVEAYCKRLERREREISKVRAAMLRQIKREQGS